MKIAITILRHRGRGGGQGFVNRLSVRLVERGHEVTIVCRTHEAPPHPSVRFVVLRTVAVGSGWRTWSFARTVERHLASARYDAVLGMGRCWRQDVVRMGGGCHASYLELAHRYTMSPLRSWLDAWFIKHRIILQIERRIFADPTQRIIAISGLVKNDIVRRYQVDPDRIAVVHNGVDVARFDPGLRTEVGAQIRNQWSIPADAPLLLFLGSSFGRKGLDIALEAFARLRSEGSAAHLAVVGTDRNPSQYERLSRRLGVASFVRFVGQHRSPEACFAAADVFVLPSRYDAFSNSTLEALASGLPAIVSACDGASELIRHRTTGSILPAPPEPAALAEELKFWTQPGMADSARREARETAVAHSDQVEADATSAILEKAARERGAAP